MPIIYNIGTFLRAWAGEAAETRSQFHPRKKNNKNNPQTTEYLHKAHCRIFGLRLSHTPMLHTLTQRLLFTSVPRR